MSESAPDQGLRKSAPYPVFLRSKVSFGGSKLGVLRDGVPACNTLKGTHPSIPGAYLGPHDSAGRAVRRLCAKRRGQGRRKLIYRELPVIRLL